MAAVRRGVSWCSDDAGDEHTDRKGLEVPKLPPCAAAATAAGTHSGASTAADTAGGTCPTATHYLTVRSSPYSFFCTASFKKRFNCSSSNTKQQRSSSRTAGTSHLIKTA